jgi:hypothetical protein
MGNPAAAQTPRERMRALTNAQSPRILCDALLDLDARPELNDAERLTRAIIIDSICARCPAANAAREAWLESDDEDPREPVRAIVAAVMAA